MVSAILKFYLCFHNWNTTYPLFHNVICMIGHFYDNSKSIFKKKTELFSYILYFFIMYSIPTFEFSYMGTAWNVSERDYSNWKKFPYRKLVPFLISNQTTINLLRTSKPIKKTLVLVGHELNYCSTVLSVADYEDDSEVTNGTKLVTRYTNKGSQIWQNITHIELLHPLQINF